MAGIYIHIPFCKQKCHYCNFYSIASRKNKDHLIGALIKEIELQKNYLAGEKIKTIYFGGGTPSLLTSDELNRIFNQIAKFFKINSEAEITFEANPDDLDKSKITALRETPINRLSIGVQSFFDEDLKYLNRIHSVQQALQSIKNAKEAGFQNLSIDLIYGIPTLSEKNWLANLEKFFSLNLQHLSGYALTVEPKTALDILIKKKKTEAVKEQRIIEHFQVLTTQMKENGYVHYEISNFCKEPYFSKHNKSYWFGEKYIGLGPSAHSYDGKSRQWNVSNISKYISEVEKNIIPAEIEKLTPVQKYNEYVLTSLRTMWGTDLNFISKQFGNEIAKYFKSNVKNYVSSGKVMEKNGKYFLTVKGKLFADRIASNLFC
ncbi:MAG: radical SAM family heme chaperone HemW [Bacteroidales bacterium]|nr:radical SAM family heme chaperone HemW [Bacteroidales bacterium]